MYTKFLNNLYYLCIICINLISISIYFTTLNTYNTQLRKIIKKNMTASIPNKI